MNRSLRKRIINIRKITTQENRKKYKWIGAVQKDLKNIVLPEFVYDCLSGTIKNRQSKDDTVQER